MLEPQTRKRKLQKSDDEPNPKKKKLQIDENCSTSYKANGVSSKPNECNALVKRESDGTLAMLPSTPVFQLNEIVWAKIKGWPAWLAKIVDFPSTKMAVVIWFNDNRKTKVYRTQLYKFLANYEQFSINFDKHIGLKTATREALYSFSTTL